MVNVSKEEIKELIKEVIDEGIPTLKIGDHTAYITNNRLWISAGSPKIEFEGAETGGMHLSVRETQGSVDIYDESAGSVRWAVSGTTGRRRTPLIDGSEIADDAIGSEHIADGAVTEARAAFLIQSGSVAPAGYFVYPTALSSLTGWPVACPITTVSGYADVGVTAANAGSCYVEGGSPGIYAGVMVYGVK